MSRRSLTVTFLVVSFTVVSGMYSEIFQPVVRPTTPPQSHPVIRRLIVEGTDPAKLEPVVGYSEVVK